jgi:nucleotide-binding universal stress UspA family protein
MLKNLLVPIDGSEYFLKAVEYAIHMASKRNVKIIGLAPINESALPVPAFQKEHEPIPVPAHIAEQVKRSIGEFKLLMTQNKLSKDHYEIKESVGNPFYNIVRESVFCDAIVVGQQCHFPPQTEKEDTLNQLLYRSSRPILFTPLSYKPIKKVVLGLDGTAPTSRILYHIINMDPFPGAKIVLVHTKEEEETYKLGDFFRKIEQYFKEEKFEVQTVTKDEPFEKAILDTTSEEGGDLIAFGIQETRFQDKVVFDWNMVRNIIKKSGLPILSLR